jgi:anti-sigma regulatory factor (Ser/Thr protein kinase)
MNVISARDAFEGNPLIDVKSALPAWICLRIAPDMQARRAVVDFFRSHMENLSCELCDQLATALDELVGNALEHGCRVDPNCPCELNYIRTARMIVLHVRDAGPGFDLNGVRHAAVNNPPDNPLHHIKARAEKGMRPGGFGILLVQQIADEVIYTEQGNEVLLVKYL